MLVWHPSMVSGEAQTKAIQPFAQTCRCSPRLNAAASSASTADASVAMQRQPASATMQPIHTLREGFCPAHTKVGSKPSLQASSK